MNAQMIKVIAQRFRLVLLAGLALCLTQACTSGLDQAGGSSVAEAYETSGVVSVNPYTRTIFSSTNF
jgi:hypothetical protein